jgi:hypothetical protein
MDQMTSVTTASNRMLLRSSLLAYKSARVLGQEQQQAERLGLQNDWRSIPEEAELSVIDLESLESVNHGPCPSGFSDSS